MLWGYRLLHIISRLLNVTVSMLWGYLPSPHHFQAVTCHCIHAVRVSSFSTSFPRLSNVTVSILWGYLPSPHHSKLLNVTVSCCGGIVLLHIISKAVKCHCIHAVRVSSFSTSFPRLSNVTVSMLWGIFLLHIISKAVKCHCIHAVRVSSFSTSFPRLSNVTVSMLWGYLPSPHHFKGCQMSLYPCCESIFLLHIISKGCQMSLYPCCESIFLLHIISKAVKCHCIHAVRVSSFSTSFPRLSNVTVSMLWGYLPSPHHFQGCQMSLYPCCESIFLLHIISKAVKCHCIHAVRVSSFSTSFQRLSNVTVSMLWGYLPSPHHFQGCQMSLYPCCEGIFLLHIISKAVKCHCIHAVRYLPSPHHFQGCQMSLYPCCEGIFLLHIISKAVKCHCIHAVRVSSFSTSFQRLSNVTVSMLWEYLPSPHHFKGCQMSLYPCCESIFLLHIISKAVKCHCIHAVRVSSFSTSFLRLSNVTVSMLWGYLPSPHHFQGC